MKDQILLIDKPVNWTSFDVVAKIRGTIHRDYVEKGLKPTKKQLRVGHAGTLDPFATGLLIILVGEATKKADEFLKLDKVYEAEITLGATSTTGDPEGEITTTPQSSDFKGPSLEKVRSAVAKFEGEIMQRPPAYSAIKVGGKRAYSLARKGEKVEMPKRKVHIYNLEIISYNYPSLKLKVHVGSGTYIRSLAEDIGEALGTGAYCCMLNRLSVGGWKLLDSSSIGSIMKTLKD